VGYITLTPYLEKFPGIANLPTDLNGDYVYEDINGNGRLDYNDVVTYYQNMDWMKGNTRVDFENYDYNFNGRVDYGDIVNLYWKILNR
jgi:PKD repeat protein